MIQNIFLIMFLFAVGIFLPVVVLLLKKSRKLESENKSYQTKTSRYRTFIDAVDSKIYLKDESLHYVFVNKAFCEFAGKQEKEILGKDDYGIMDPELAKKRHALGMETLEKKIPVQTEFEWNNQVFRETEFPACMENGKTGIGAYMRDVTAEYLNRKKLQKTVLRNNILLDVINRPFETTKLQMDYVLNEALKLTESKYGYIFLFDQEKEEFTLNTWSCDVEISCRLSDQAKHTLKNVGFWGEVVRQKKPVLDNDFKAPGPLKNGLPPGHVEISRFMSIPVLIDDRIVAIVGLANKEEDYDENDVFHMTVLMAGVWNAKTRKEFQEKLFFERNEYLQTLVSIGDGVMVVDRQGRIEMLNRTAQNLTGWSLEEAVGQQYHNVFLVSVEDGINMVKDPIRQAMITDSVQVQKDPVILISKNGDKCCVENSAAPIRDEKNNMIGVVLIFRDVTEKKEQRQEIEYLSFHDPLTGLYNRRFFEEAMLCLDIQPNIPISIIMGDVNGLKLTNDIFGHSYGDVLLKKFSQVLQKVVRADDIVARFGGDEFVLLLPKTSREEAMQIIKDVKARFELEQVKAIKGSISMGLDTKQEETEDLMHVLENAEEKMYIEKALERKSAKGTVINEIVQMLHQNSELEKMHALRVSAICYAFGRRLNLPDVELRKLRDAGYLHDIGKIGLETKILNNKMVLTTKEWGTVKRHPIIGFRILNAFDGTLDLAESVLTHHERWDGSGYPKGLKGDEIPLIARIIALAESYDRIVFSGEVSPQEAHEAAAESINKNSGVQFDPIIAQTFLRFVDEPERLETELKDAVHIRF